MLECSEGHRGPDQGMGLFLRYSPVGGGPLQELILLRCAFPGPCGYLPSKLTSIMQLRSLYSCSWGHRLARSVEIVPDLQVLGSKVLLTCSMAGARACIKQWLSSSCPACPSPYRHLGVRLSQNLYDIAGRVRLPASTGE